MKCWYVNAVVTLKLEAGVYEINHSYDMSTNNAGGVAGVEPLQKKQHRLL